MKFLILLLSIGLLGLNGCARAPTPVLSIGCNIWPGYEPLYLARDLGYFQDMPIHPVEFISTTQGIRAYRNNTIDGVCLTLDEALLLASSTPDVRIVMVADFSNGADAIIGAPETQTMQELKGRRVGVEDTALGAFFLMRALQESGMDVGDIQVVPMQVQDHENAFTAGKVDAVVTFEPVRGKLLAQGGHNLFDSSQIPSEIVDVLVVRASYLQNHPQVVADLVQGWLRAQDYIAQSEVDAVARIARRQAVPDDVVRGALKNMHMPSREENRQLLSGSEPELNNALRQLADFMLQNKLLHKAAPVDTLISAEALLLAGQ